jgi:D-amino peptidase
VQEGMFLKIYISADMEGITGVTGTAEVTEGKGYYRRFCSLMTADINAAVRGAFAAGATEVLVNDAHWGMRNIIIEELDPRAQLLSGSHNKPMMQGLDASFAAVFFIGYHAMAGTEGAVINHTLLGREITGVWINGRKVGELGLNAAFAGHYQVPVVMVTGDDKVAQEAKAFLGRVETVIVKEGIERWAAKCYSPQLTAQWIEAKAYRSLQNIKLYHPCSVMCPVELTIEFLSTSAAEIATLMPGVVKKTPRKVSITGRHMLETYNILRAIMILSASASDQWYG